MRISAEVIRVLAPILCYDESIPFRGIHIEPHEEGGAWIVVLDGVCIGAYHDQTAENVRSFNFVPSKALLSACKMVRGIPRTVEIDDIGNARVLQGEMPVYIEALPVGHTDQYPEWKHLFERHVPGALGEICIDPRDVRKFERLGVVRLTFSGEDRLPIKIESRDHPQFMGLMMPRESDWTL